MCADNNGYTFAQILSRIRNRCKRVINDIRIGLVKEIGGGFKINGARGPESSGFVVEADPIRAALIVLVHHSIVTPKLGEGEVSSNHKKGNVNYRYTIDVDRARYMVRYPKYIEHAKKVMDENAAAIVEELLVHGRMRTEDAVAGAMESVQRFLQANKEDDDEDGDDDDKVKEEVVDEAERDILREGVVSSFQQLVDGGYVQQIKPIEESTNHPDKDQDPDEGETEADFKLNMDAIAACKTEPDEIASSNKRKKDDTDHDEHKSSDDPKIVTILSSQHKYRRTFPPGSVWRVNPYMFHANIRAFCLGRLVAERYGKKVDSAGFIVTAALKLAAHEKFKPRPNIGLLSAEEEQQRLEGKGVFTPGDIIDYLPTAVSHNMKNKAGGAKSNLSRSLVALTQFTWPQVVYEIEEARGHPEGGKFEIAVRQLVEHLQGRLLHQVVMDHHGETASRICSILEARGSMESDVIAEAAMVPVKDVREILHRLYTSGFIHLHNMQQTKQHNPSTAIYLWSLDKPRMFKAVSDNVLTAFHNLRLRRQHEVQLGKDWIERAKEASGDSGIDENEHEADKANYEKFCTGLERLDNAMLQLDETLMVLKDFLLW